MQSNRRRFLQMTAAGSAVAALPFGLNACSKSVNKAKVVVIGGGFAGATAARYMSMWAPDIDITVIEPNKAFVSCPQSNLVLSGSRTINELTRQYDKLAANPSISWVQDIVTGIDTDKRQVVVNSGDKFHYDRLIIAPGIAFNYDQLPMLASVEAQQKVPHAWKAGPQTTLLHQQLESMPTGGTVVMTIPSGPYRCPPGPYERACQIALHLKRHNPTGKLLVLDANPDIVSKKGLFTNAWEQLYSGLIEYIPTSAVEHVDVASLKIETLFDTYQADVLNVIPPQLAGKVAEMAGVINIDNRWCDVDFRSYESTAVANVHVIGDAVAAKTPKSGHIANQQAKVCAAAVISLLREQTPNAEPVFSNTCYSFVSEKQAMHVANVYRFDAEAKEMLTMDGGGVSAEANEQEARYAQGWAENIWADILG
ncbi:NAD(P)/FAD-dependent oxidoreductase [Methylophaga sp. OBS3]|uniref:NAD(P)/FAD-dependent oxidoreductase n=1 Tax=Methylophaga sp. OBS3 TaxID=2991934 RepID=UPI00224E0DED|nr:NAD(P)/FAD-dependent oxidoreductase [Methylophaga sp. OBS3]MCX4188786.1 NAD(P)/FAD-dependent oxidoreductase [Methylophaga sp. OBS3]